MSAFDMVAFIVLVACITKVVITIFRRKQAEPDPELLQRLRRAEALEERVRVLEKIVTDGRYDLKRQLDDLERTP